MATLLAFAGAILNLSVATPARSLVDPASMMGGSWMGSHFTNDDLVKDSRLVEETYDIDLAFDGRIVPGVINMRPADKPDQRTTIRYEELEFNIDIDPSFFSLRTLQRRR